MWRQTQKGELTILGNESNGPRCAVLRLVLNCTVGQGKGTSVLSATGKHSQAVQGSSGLGGQVEVVQAAVGRA